MRNREALGVVVALVRSFAGCALLLIAGCDAAPPQQVMDEPARSLMSQSALLSSPEPLTSSAAVPEPEPEPVAARSPSPAETSFAPRDDCSLQAGWTAFAERLRTAVAARDTVAIAGLAAPDIKLDYGGGSGTDELKKRLADPKAPLWHEMDEALALGCAMEGGLAALPWYFWHMPDDTDSATAMLITGGAIALRKRPAATADPVTRLDWAMVSIDPVTFDPKAPFAAVRTRNGATGYVATAKLRSVLSTRVIAEPNDGGNWRITAIIAGD